MATLPWNGWLLSRGMGGYFAVEYADAMADNNNIAKAMVIAPIAGIAAAFSKFYKVTKPENEEES